MSTRSADSFLEENTILNDISQKVSRLAQINMMLKDLLPPDLVDHCHATDLEQGCLVLTAADNGFGMLLRYQTQTILSGLRKNPALAGLTAIKTKVRPKEPLPAEIKKPLPQKLQPITLSQQASAALLECAKNIPDESIRHALEQLASNYKERK